MSEVIDIYHGSPNIIERPVFGEGKVHNDYGRGFYCTEHAELAKEWACSSDNDGYANHYQLDMTGLTVLNLNTPEYVKYAPLKGLTNDDVQRMIKDRKAYLKRLLTTKEGFTMEGLNAGFTLQVTHLRPASSVEVQVQNLQQQFVKMQWESEQYEI